MLSLQLVKNYASELHIPLVSSERGIKLRGSQGYIMFTICIAIFTDIFLYGVVVPVIPFAFRERMGVTGSMEKMVSYNLAIYSGGLIAGSIMFGIISDKTRERRWLMLLSMVGSFVSVALELVATSVGLFLVARFIQGASAAIWVVALALINDTVVAVNPPGADISHQVASHMGLAAGTCTTLALFMGPLFGGIVFERAGYYAVWYVCFGILAFDTLLQIFLIEKRNMPTKLARFNIEYKVTSHEEPSSDSGPKIKIPAMLQLLRFPRILVALWQTTALAWAMTSIDTNMVVHLKELFGFNALEAGLMFMAIAVPNILEGPFGHYTTKYNITKYTVAGGFILGGVFMILLRLPEYHSAQQVVLFAAMLAMFGLSVAFIFPIMTSEIFIVAAIEKKKAPNKLGDKITGQAGSLFNLAFAVGSLCGPLQSSALMSSHGWKWMTLVLGIIMLVTSIPTLLYTNGELFKPKEKKQFDELIN